MSGLVYYFIDLDRADKKDGCDIYCVRKVNKLAERCGTAPVYLDAKYSNYIIFVAFFFPFVFYHGLDTYDGHQSNVGLLWAQILTGTCMLGRYPCSL